MEGLESEPCVNRGFSSAQRPAPLCWGQTGTQAAGAEFWRVLPSPRTGVLTGEGSGAKARGAGAGALRWSTSEPRWSCLQWVLNHFWCSASLGTRDGCTCASRCHSRSSPSQLFTEKFPPSAAAALSLVWSCCRKPMCQSRPTASLERVSGPSQKTGQSSLQPNLFSPAFVWRKQVGTWPSLSECKFPLTLC